MFLHIGKDVMVKSSDIIMILDYKKIKKSPQTQNFLENISKRGLIENEEINKKIVKTIVVTNNKIFFSPIQTNTLEKRIKNIII